jgi:hypothetical protein
MPTEQRGLLLSRLLETIPADERGAVFLVSYEETIRQLRKFSDMARALHEQRDTLLAALTEIRDGKLPGCDAQLVAEEALKK